MLRLASSTGVRHARAGVRSNSTVAKASSAASTVLARAQTVLSASVYWTKVGLELGKYIWVKEGLSPPTTQAFQKVFTQDVKTLLNTVQNNQKSISHLFVNISRDQWIRVAAGGVQLLGLFSLGEIIGRRHVYGYKDHSHSH